MVAFLSILANGEMQLSSGSPENGLQPKLHSQENFTFGGAQFFAGKSGKDGMNAPESVALCAKMSAPKGGTFALLSSMHGPSSLAKRSKFGSTVGAPPTDDSNEAMQESAKSAIIGGKLQIRAQVTE